MCLFLAALLVLTGCSDGLLGDPETHGGGTMSVVLADEASGTELSWVFAGVDEAQLANAHAEPLSPLYVGNRGGGLQNYQPGGKMYLAAIARNGELEDPAFPSFGFQSSGPVQPSCLEAIDTLYFEYSHELSVGSSLKNDAGFMLIKLLDDSVNRPNYNSEAITSAVFWDADHPNLDDFASVSDEGSAPPPNADVELELFEPGSGHLFVTNVAWKWKSDDCWADWNPDIEVEWAFE